jgi:hypothetical protein
MVSRYGGLWLHVTVPEGVHRVSLYFFNKDGHTGQNRLRDYLVEVRVWTNSIDAQHLQPVLARCRVRDFWGGLYKQFLLSGPGQYCVHVTRNRSSNTILQAAFIDQLQPDPPAGQDMSSPVYGMIPSPRPSWDISAESMPVIKRSGAGRSLIMAASRCSATPAAASLQAEARVLIWRRLERLSSHSDDQFAVLKRRWREGAEVWDKDDATSWEQWARASRAAFLSLLNPAHAGRGTGASRNSAGTGSMQ